MADILSAIPVLYLTQPRQMYDETCNGSSGDNRCHFPVIAKKRQVKHNSHYSGSNGR